MKEVTASKLNYLEVCRRKLWLFSHDICMEQTSDLVKQGKNLHEKSYPRRAAKYTEVHIENIKIDFYDPEHGIVHEIKKSPKLEKAHILQVQFYLYELRRHGIKANYGILEYPQQHITREVRLEEDDIPILEDKIRQTQQLMQSEKCPEVVRKNYCKSCSYHDYCFVE